MRRRASDLAKVPESLWQRPEMILALRGRDIGRVFQLVRQYAGISQTQLAIACAMTQPKISGIMRGVSKVEELAVFLRIADGLNMPPEARMALGLAPAVRELPAADPAEDEEDADPVQRRTFFGLTGASLFRAVLADSGRDPSDAIESIAAALAPVSGIGYAAVDAPPDLSVLADAVAGAKRGYQACAYFQVTRDLPQLLARLQAARAELTEPKRLLACPALRRGVSRHRKRPAQSWRPRPRLARR